MKYVIRTKKLDTLIDIVIQEQIKDTIIRHIKTQHMELNSCQPNIDIDEISCTYIIHDKDIPQYDQEPQTIHASSRYIEKSYQVQTTTQ